MQYVTSTERGSFYVDFQRGLLYLFSRNSRVGVSSKFTADKEDLKLHIQDPQLREAFDHPSQIACLALMEKYEADLEAFSAAKRLFTSLSYDLNDEACRDFNSFGGQK